MKQIYILHLGAGQVGKKLIEQINESEKKVKKEFDTNILFCGVFTSENGVVDKKGMSSGKVLKIIKENNFFGNEEVENVIGQIKSPFILVDTTASDSTYSNILSALKKGGYVVMSNKKPLVQSQKKFDSMHKIGKNKIFYETTVGAGLPIIKTIRDLTDTGDEVLEIKGCFSGTLGYIFSELDGGNRFSEVVACAKKKGFTEPDPRDDLSGMDVARKILILSRIIGQQREFGDIKLKSLVLSNMNELNTNDFLKNLDKLDRTYKEKIDKAKRKNKVLRFVGKVNRFDLTVGLEEVDESGEFGRLKGPDNLVVIKTKRYFSNPLIIKGPGAGVDVTAAGVFANILDAVKIINKG